MYYSKNNHPAIIPREVFYRVKEEMARRTSKRKVMQKTAKTEQGKYSAKYALSELLICGECGTPYKRCTWARNGKKRIVWRCVSRLEFGTKYCRNSPTLDEDKYVTFNQGSVAVDGSPVRTTFNSKTRQLTADLGNIAPGQSKVLTFSALVNNAAYGKKFSNTAVMSADNSEEIPAADTGVTVAAGVPEGSSGAKTVSKSKANVGDTLTYISPTLNVVSNEANAAKLNAVFQAMGYPVPAKEKQEEPAKKAIPRAPQERSSGGRGNGSKQTMERSTDKPSVKNRLEALRAASEGMKSGPAKNKIKEHIR